MSRQRPERSPAETGESIEFPFRGNVLEVEPLRRIRAEYVLSLDEHRFLGDHCLVDEDGGLKPLSERLPLLPMTMGLEMMAEVASSLATGSSLSGFEAVSASRWIGFVDTESIQLDVTATRALEDPDGSNGAAVDVAIRTDAGARPAMSGRVRFGSEGASDVRSISAAAGDRRPCGLDAGRIYSERRLFHGPSFQCLSGEPMLGKHSVFGEILVLSDAALFRSSRNPRLLSHPVVLDGVGQLIGVWAMKQGLTVFPVGLGTLEFCGPPPATGTRLPVHIEITGNEWRLLDARVEIQDGSGRIWARIEGWRHWAFRWSQRILDFRRQPYSHLASTRFEDVAVPEGATCRWFPIAELEGDQFDVTARYTLSRSEMQEFRLLAESSVKQGQWLAEKIVAKDALRSFLGASTDSGPGRAMLLPASFSLTRASAGVREWEVSREECQINFPVGLSVGLGADIAVAIAHEKPVGVGLAEITDRGEEAARISAARQAGQKLIGADREDGVGDLELSATGEQNMELTMESGRRMLSVRTARHGELMMAFAVWAGPDSSPTEVALEHVAY